MPVSFVIETLSCELALANCSSKISGNLVSGPLLVHVSQGTHTNCVTVCSFKIIRECMGKTERFLIT